MGDPTLFASCREILGRMLAARKLTAVSASMSRALISRFSTMNPMAEAKRAEEIRNVLDSVCTIMCAIHSSGDRTLHEPASEEAELGQEHQTHGAWRIVRHGDDFQRVSEV